MDSTTDPSGDLSASESAEETSSSKSEEQQDGRFSFAEIYTYYIKDGRYPSSFFKVDKQALRKRAKFFMVKGTQLYYVGGGRYYSNSNAAAYNMLIAYNIMQHYYYCFSYATWHHGL